MRSQEKLRGSIVLLEELKWEWRMPKQVESLSSEKQFILTSAWKSRGKSVEADASKIKHFTSSILMSHDFFS